MRSVVKSLVPAGLLRQLRARRVLRNRRAIVAASRRHEPLVLVPDTVVEHYYHFLLDLTLPLYLVLEAAPPDRSFVLRTTGPFLDRLKPLFPDRLTIVDKTFDATGMATHLLLGMNAFFVNIAAEEMLAFSRHVRSRLAVDEDVERRRVILIERLPPQEFFTTAARSKGGGTRRRNIPNHAELAEALQSQVRPPFEFQNVQLEQLSFAEQVRVFSEAALVVAQHGAGLANCMWMHPGSNVVELTNNPGLSHFQRISQAMGLHHLVHRTGGTHAVVDVAGLIEQLSADARLAAIVGGS
jgi:hypothetical protein